MEHMKTLIIALLTMYSIGCTYMYFKLKKDSGHLFDLSDRHENTQQNLSWYINAFETKQIDYAKIESVAEKLKEENTALKNKISSIEQSFLDLPKLLGKNLGK